MRCVLHIGMPKTGSSSIQQSLKDFKDKNYDYLKIGPANHSHLMYTSFGDNPENYHINVKSGRSKDEIYELRESFIRNIASYIENSNSKNIIISAEDLSSPNQRNWARKMKCFFDDYVDEYKIVGYVRDPVSYINSMFQQRVKGGGDTLDFATLFPKYRAMFEKYDEIFGKENVDLIDFSVGSLIKGNVVNDFCERLGISISPEKITRENISLSLEAVSLLFAYRRFGSGYGNYLNSAKDNMSLISSLSSIGTQKLKFNRDVLRDVLEENHQHISWISERVGRDYMVQLDGVSESGIGTEDDFLYMAGEHINLIKKILHDEIDEFYGAEGASKLIELHKLILTGRIRETDLF